MAPRIARAGLWAALLLCAGWVLGSGPSGVAAALASESYKLDPAHTDVTFAIDHLGFSKTWGRFNEIDGTIVLDQDAPENSIVFVVIQAASIDTRHAKRDENLRGVDFFDTATFPAIITSVALRMPSTSDSRHPYLLSNFDLVTESFTLMAGNGSWPFFCSW